MLGRESNYAKTGFEKYKFKSLGNLCHLLVDVPESPSEVTEEIGLGYEEPECCLPGLNAGTACIGRRALEEDVGCHQGGTWLLEENQIQSDAHPSHPACHSSDSSCEYWY